jgi:hypothetical protein
VRGDEEEEPGDGECDADHHHPHFLEPWRQEFGCDQPDACDENQKERDLCDTDAREMSDGQEEKHGRYFRQPSAPLQQPSKRCRLARRAPTGVAAEESKDTVERGGIRWHWDRRAERAPACRILTRAKYLTNECQE